MISEYVLNELHKLFPKSKIYIVFSEGNTYVEATGKDGRSFDKAIFNYNAGTKELWLGIDITLDKLQELLSLLSIVRNVKLKEVKEDE